MGTPWESHANEELPWESHWNPMVVSLESHGSPMGTLWEFHGIFYNFAGVGLLKYPAREYRVRWCFPQPPYGTNAEYSCIVALMTKSTAGGVTFKVSILSGSKPLARAATLFLSSLTRMCSWVSRYRVELL